ncbi:hypothetical protein MauCBS54593_005827 [Microsporum audouinii]
METVDGRASPHTVSVRRLDNIRASCDNCSRPKVRCSKEQPKCQRCVHQGVSCIYSPSQRRRRPLRDSIVTSPQRNILTRDIEVNNRTAADHSGYNIQAHLQSNADSHDDKVQERLSGFDMDFDRAQARADSNQLFPESSMFQADIDSPSQWGGLVPTLDEPSHSIPWPFDQPGPFYDLDPQLSSRTHRDEGAKSPQLPSAQAGFDETTASSSTYSHQCSDLATSTIQKLDIPMLPCSSVTSPGAAAAMAAAAIAGGTVAPMLFPQSGQDARRGSRSFEIILRDNRTALDYMLTILQCPCTTKAELAFLVTAVCSRVLSWYEASLERSGSNDSTSANDSTSSSGASCGSTAATTSSSTSSPPFFDWVSIPSIRMGAYALDHEHSERMVAQLIQTELTKVKEVIDTFARTYCGRNDGPSKYGSNALTNEDKLHLALEAFLRSRLRAAIRAAREHLS